MTPTRPPTPRQLDLLRLLARENDRGGSPTFREIAAALGIRSTNAVSDLMIGLEARGLIEPRRIGAFRAARVTGAGRALLGESLPLSAAPAVGRWTSPTPTVIAFAREAFEAGYRQARLDGAVDRGPDAVDVSFAGWLARVKNGC